MVGWLTFPAEVLPVLEAVLFSSREYLNNAYLVKRAGQWKKERAGVSIFDFALDSKLH